MGNTLTISWFELGEAALLCTLIGAFHLIFREKFLLISRDEARTKWQGVTIQLWGLLFYMSCGSVATSSVAIAGVLPVLRFLIVSSVAAMPFSEWLGVRPMIGCGKCVGIHRRRHALMRPDLPAGATIAATATWKLDYEEA